MPAWRKGERMITFRDMPQRLVAAEDDAAKREREAWLEKHNLALVDFMSWRRAQDPLAKRRPPSRRKFMSSKERADLDTEIEREGFQW